jgi:hypothetical protein
MVIEVKVLHIKDCPGLEGTIDSLRLILGGRTGITYTAEEVNIENLPPDFSGSPAVVYRKVGNVRWKELFGYKGVSVATCKVYESDGESISGISIETIEKRMRELGLIKPVFS